MRHCHLATTLLIVSTTFSLSAIQFPLGHPRVALVLAQPAATSKSEAERSLNQGEIELQRNDRDQWQAALQSFQKALALYQAVSDRKGQSQALLGVGTAYLSLDDYANAKRYLQNALTLAQDLKDAELESRVLTSLGTTYRFSGPDQFDQGVELYQKSLKLAQSIQNSKAEMKALKLLGLALLLRDGPSVGLPLMQQAVVKARKVSTQETAETLNALGYAYYLSHDFQLGLQAFSEAAKVANSLKDSSQGGRSYKGIASLYTQRGQHGKSLEFYQKALALYRKDAYSKSEVVDVLLSLALTYQNLGRYQDMLVAGKESLALAQDLKKESTLFDALEKLCFVTYLLGQYEEQVSYAHIGLKKAQSSGNLFYQFGFLQQLMLGYGLLGQNDKAQQFKTLSNALPSYGELTAKHVQAMSQNSGLPKDLKIPNFLNASSDLWFQGYALQQKKQYAQAESIFKQSLQAAQSVENHKDQLNALTSLANLYGDQQQYNQAINAYNKLVSQAQEWGYLFEQSAGWTLMAGTYYQMGQYANAIAPYQAAIAIEKKEQLRDTLSRNLMLLGDCYLRLGRLSEAQATFLEAVKLSESMRAGLLDTNKISLMDMHSFVYQQLQRTLVAQKQVEAALEIAERGRARAFAELLASRIQGVPKLNPPSVSQIQNIAKTQNATLVLYSLIKYESKNTQPYHELFIWVIQPSGKITLRQVDLNAFLNNGKSLKELVQIVRQSIVRARGESRDTPSNPEPEPNAPRQLNPELQELYKLLIQPIADLLPTNATQQVVFLPQKDLFLVPFAALQNNQGTYLIEQHTIRTAPSLQVLDLTHQQHQRIKGKSQGVIVAGRPRQPLIIGNPVPMPQPFQPLVGAEREAQDVANSLKSQALLREAATETEIVQQMPDARIVHLATHGVFNDTDPLANSFLALAPSSTDDGRLTAGEVLDNLKLNAELVVLSACDTGRGQITGDGVVGLSRAFIAAGAPSIVVSLWKIPDEPTALLMSEFYRHWPRNPDKSQALRQAMLSTMKQYPSPWNWAAFTLIGESQ